MSVTNRQSDKQILKQTTEICNSNRQLQQSGLEIVANLEPIFVFMIEIQSIYLTIITLHKHVTNKKSMRKK